MTATQSPALTRDELTREIAVLDGRLKNQALAIAAAKVCNKITMTFSGKKVGEVGTLVPTDAQVWGGLLDEHDLRNAVVYTLEAQQARWQSELENCRKQLAGMEKA